jgi:prephenate dehydrogenase (NADP+)
MYSVEAEFIERVVAQYGPCTFICSLWEDLALTEILNPATKVDAIVAGQTSVKAPEKTAFEKSLPEDTEIVSCHSLHGPSVSPVGQPLVSRIQSLQE